MIESEIAALSHTVLREYRPEGLLFGGLVVRFGTSVRAIGLAHYPSERAHIVANDRPKITYSGPLFAVMPEQEQRDTVIHEVAHLLVADDWQRRRALGGDAPRCGAPPKGHGLEWKTWMIRMGGQPRATCRDEHTNAAARTLLHEKRLRRDGVRLVCRCQEWVLPLHKAARSAVCPACRGGLGPADRAVAHACNLFRSATGITVPSFSEALDVKAKGMRSWTTTPTGRARIVGVARELLGEP